VGDRKMAVFDDTLPWPDKLLLYPHHIKWRNNAPVPEKGEPEHVDIPESEPLRLECEHFLHSFTNGDRPQTDGEEGLRVLKILNAAQRSLNGEGVRLKVGGQRSEDGGQRSEVRRVESASNLKPPALPAGIFVHPTAIIDDGCEIGPGTKVWHFSHILKNCMIGETCTIGQNVVIGPDVTIGNQCKIQNNVSVYKGVTLEDGVFCGPSMVFTNIYNPRARIVKMDQVRPTLVKQGATLGANCTIVCGNTIGRHAFVGAGALVNKNVKDYALVVGNPARQIGWACECGERLTDSLECLSCNAKYKKSEDGIEELKGSEARIQEIENRR